MRNGLSTYVDVIWLSGCLACEYCHTKGEGKCIQQDDMQELYLLLEESEDCFGIPCLLP